MLADRARDWLRDYVAQQGVELDEFDGLVVGWDEARAVPKAIKRTQLKLDTWLWKRAMRRLRIEMWRLPRDCRQTHAMGAESNVEQQWPTLVQPAIGAISGSLSGCSVTGTVTPDSQKNFYTVLITFGGSPCLLPNQTATGIAITYQISGSTRHQLLAGGATSSGGTVFAAIR